MAARRNVLETMEDCELIKRYRLNREGIKLVVELFIRFPLDNQQLHRRIKANFMVWPGVVGAIDGTHVQIIAPSKDEDVFVNRKKVHSINTQIAFDATFNILDVAKWPAGSTHDPRILMGSGLRREAPCTSWVSCWVTVAVPARRLDTLSQSTTGSTVKV
ncbi:putative nuclease HARBI1 [Merluccius polli]|uniref:Nuclease HARBI1 n=1 Tax=Merluccius polli TaxID=89951 RepID=A0AA47M1P9_MERPO|nr:putative nuclease HARBI1 [Merluccius polli]